jgi:hypothetical protein
MTMLQPSITHKFTGTIWRLEIDTITDTIVLEVRNEAEKQTSFSSLGLSTGKINFIDFTTPERWLTGMECVYDNVLLLHHYRHESGPEHKAIIAIDAQTGAEIWSNYSLAFDHLSINGPVVYNTNILPKKLSVLEIHSGVTKSAYDTDSDKPLENNIVIPHMVTADQLPGSLPAKPYGNFVHYHDHNKYRIVSLHTQKNGLLQQQLFITMGAEIIYSDFLNTGIQKLQPEAFVLHKNALIYIKNRTEINVLNL